MNKERKVQYTIRGISEQADRRLREKAVQYGKSLNETAVDALSSGLGLEAEAVVHHDLDDLIGSWIQDGAFDKAMEDMDRVDQGLSDMRLAFDTNRYRDFCEGLPGAVERFRTADRLYLPFPVVAELRAGFACGSLARKNERVLNLFLTRSRVQVLYPDDQTTFHYARLYRQLREQGTPIPTNDLWIASLVEQHNLLLYSRDQHFDALPQLARIE